MEDDVPNRQPAINEMSGVAGETMHKVEWKERVKIMEVVDVRESTAAPKLGFQAVEEMWKLWEGMYLMCWL